MKTPLDDIKDGHRFQQIVAEYFRWLKDERQEYHIADISVEDNGVGADDGCDILVEFHFEDAIGKHTHRWVIECKCHERPVGNSDLNTNGMSAIIKSNAASGYLLICKTDATAPLKRWFKKMSENENINYIIWNGSQLWSKFSKSEKFLKSFFPDFYREKFIDTRDKMNYETLYKQFQNELKK